MAEGSRFRRLLTRLYQPRLLLLAAFVGGLGIATPQIMRLTGQLREQPEYAMHASAIRLSPPPPHVPATLLRDALDRAGLEETFSRLEPNLADRLYTALGEEPWIESVDQVRVLRTGVELQLSYRHPALAVQTPAGRYLVSSDGVLLPSDTADRLDLSHLPHLLGDRKAPISPAGQRWRDRDVVAAAALATQLTTAEDDRQSLWDRCGFTTLRAVGPHQWEIDADGRSVVYWGSSAETVTEPTPSQKAQRLEKLLDVRGQLADSSGPYRIDLTRWDMIALEPILMR